MKNKIFKKSISLVLTVLVVMSSWVFFPGMIPEAEAADGSVNMSAWTAVYNNSDSARGDSTKIVICSDGEVGNTTVGHIKFNISSFPSFMMNSTLTVNSGNHGGTQVTNCRIDVYPLDLNKCKAVSGTYKIDGIADVYGGVYNSATGVANALNYYGLKTDDKIGTIYQSQTGTHTFDVTSVVNAAKAAGQTEVCFLFIMPEIFNDGNGNSWSDTHVNYSGTSLSYTAGIYTSISSVDQLKEKISEYEGYLNGSIFYTNMYNNYRAYNNAKRYYDSVVYGGVAFDAALASNYYSELDSQMNKNTGLNETYVDYLNANITSRDGSTVSAAYRKNVIWYPWDFSWDITSNNARPTIQDTYFYFTMPNTIVGITNDSETTFPLHSFFWTATGSRYVRYVIAGSGTISSGVVGSSDFSTMAPWKISDDNNTHTTSGLSPGTDGFGGWVFEKNYRTDVSLKNEENNSNNFSYSRSKVYQISSYAQINKSSIGVNESNTYKKVDQGFTFATSNSANNGKTDYGNHYASNYSNYGGALHVVYMDTYKNNYQNWKTLIPALSYKDYNGFVYSDATNVTEHLDYASEIPLNLNLTEANRVGDISSTVTVWAQNINKGAKDLANAKAAGTTRVTNKYVDLINAITNSEAAYADGSAKYTYASWNNFVNAYNAAKAHMVSLNPAGSNVQYSSDATAIGNLATALNNARNALKERTYDVTYENMFSFSSWANSASGVIGTSNKGTMTYDIDAGTITVNNNGANTQTNPNDHYTSYGFGNGHYNMTLVPSETYTFEYTTSGGSGDQVHIFFYDDNGNAVANKANSGNPFAHAYGTGRGTHTISFTAPENATKAAFRFGSTVLGDSITFSNIFMYSHTRGDYADIANWTTRPNRTVFTYNKALDTVTLEVPVRPGYTFDGWWVDSINPNGQKDSGEQVTDGSGTVVTNLQNFGIAQDWVLYSEWTPIMYTVTWENEDGTVLKTDENITYGTTPSYDGETPTKAADAQYTYTFKGWSPEVTEVTGDVTYTATYDKTPNSVTVTWIFADGTEKTESYTYGTTPTAPQNTASFNDAAGHHTYSWPTIGAVTGNVTYEEIEKTDAHNYNQQVATDAYKATDATCTAKATYYYSCSCGAKGTTTFEYGELAAHTPGAEATCTSPQICTVCDAELAPQLAHTYDKQVATDAYKATDATCTAKATYYYSCSCGAKGTTTFEYGEMLAHSLGDWITDKEPTCITAGSKHKECANCDYTETEAIAATGVHVYGDWAQFNDGTTHRRTCTADANCTAFEEEAHNFNGALRQMDNENYHQYKCEKCDAYGVGVQMNVGEACFGEGTTFTQIADNATQHTETCKCGRVQNDGHNWAGWVADPENTTDAQGKMSNTCSECGYKKTSDCTYTKTDSYKAPTCTDNGYQGWKCSDCGNGYTEILTATGHKEAEAVNENVVDATCTTNGSYYSVVYCTVCNAELNREKVTVTAEGHKFGETVTANAATCVATGNEAYKQCTVCNKYFAANADKMSDEAKDSADAFKTKIDSNNHETTTSHEQTNATCLGVGYTAGVFCEDCDKWISGHEEIPAIAHRNKVHHEKVDATCVATGTIEYWSCPDCNKNFSDEACTTEVTDLTIGIDADNHDWNDTTYTWTETDDAWTCTASRTCKRNAAHIETDNATVESEVKTPATCEGVGTTTYTATFDVDWATKQTKELKDIEAIGHNYSVEITARPELVNGTWTDGTYTYTCKNDATHTYTEPAPRADYSELDKLVEELQALFTHEKLTDEGKSSVNKALEKAGALAENLVVSEQPQIDELVNELSRIKTAAENIIANAGKAQPIVEAISGLKVQFLEADDIVAIESLQLNAGGGFDPARLRLTNNNSTLPITVTSVVADKANIESVGTGSVIDINGALDLAITAPSSFNETGIITYTITYKIGSDATGYLMDENGDAVVFTTEAYIYVKGAAYTPYHAMDEKTLLNGVSEWDHFIEAINYGDFTLISENTASKFSDNLESGTKWYSLGTAHDTYDFDEDGCQAGCTTTAYGVGDGHAATYGYFVDTSLAPTWQAAGFRLRIVETKESTYQNATLKTIRVANDQAFINGIKGDDKTFTLTFYPSATGTQGKTWSITSTGNLAVASYANPDEEELLFGEHKNNNNFTENTVLALLTGEIPSGVTEAKFMLSPRIEFNGTVLSESVTMTSHIWLTSYDKSSLREAVNAAELAAYNPNYYVDTTYTAYQAALANAKEVLGKAETTQAEINTATETLNNAVAALTRAEYVLTVTDSIHEGADKEIEATKTEIRYYLLAKDSTFEVPFDEDAIALEKINKHDSKETLTIEGTTECTYHYWYIDFSGVQDALDAADVLINKEWCYTEDYKNKLQTARDNLEALDQADGTSTPQLQSEVDNLIKAVNDLVAAEADGSNHSHVKGDLITDKAPTCTENGAGHYDCKYCGIKISDEVIVAEGHKFSGTVTANTATCLANGNEAYKQCTVCGKFFAADADKMSGEAKDSAEAFVIAKKAHSYTGEYKWNNAVELKTHSQKCVNGCEEYGNETACTFDAVVTAPDCYNGGYTTYTCTVCKNSYNGDNIAKREHKFVYAKGDGTSHTVTCEYENCNYTATENCSGGTATCTDKAVCSKCNTAYGNVLGHDWSVTYNFAADGKTCTATRTCANDENHNVTVNATITSAVKTPATCTEKGWTTYTATFTEAWAETQTKDVIDIPAKDHNWAVTYNFAEDGKSCTATRICANDENHNVTANATITSAVKTPATCTVDGWTTYTATFKEEWAETKTLDVQDIPAINHDWSVTYNFAADGSTCTASRVCKNDATHVETANATITSAVKTPATCTVDGWTTYTATFDEEWADTKTLDVQDITAINHNWDKTKSEANLTRPELVDGTWTKGYYTYTCKNDSSHTTVEEVDRAAYTAYEAAWNNLESLLSTDITDEAKTYINKILGENKIADNLIDSEQNIVDTAEANLKYAFDQYKGSLKTYTVTFVVDGVETVTTVISGQNATAPTNVTKAYDDTYHYEFKEWDKDFTNVTSDLTVTAEFDSIEHTYTHTDKDDTYHTDSCTCGYSKDVKHTETSEVTTKASCFADGVRTYTCSVCSGTRTETIAKRTHNIVDTTVATAPTCSATGIMNQKCDCAETAEYEACDYTTTRVMDKVADAHKWETEYTVDKKASCDEAGSKSYHCEYCDTINTNSVTEIAKREHNLVDTTVALAPTCSATGIMNQKCDCAETAEYEACDYTTTRVMDKVADAHKAEAEYIETIAPTCSAVGEEKLYCEYCDAVLDTREVAIDNDAHKAEAKYIQTIAPTCSAVGEEKLYCEYCDAVLDTREVAIVKDAHTGAANVIKNAKEETCLENGYTGDIHWSCCDALETKGTEIPAPGHTEATREENRVEPSCGTAGSYDLVTYCTVCTQVIKTEKVSIPATGEHNFVTEVDGTRVPSTCKTPGSVTMKCGCGATEVQTIPVDENNHENIVTDGAVAPTCTKSGLTEGSHCAACDKVIIKQEEIPALGHKEDKDASIYIAPSCDKNGYVKRVCGVCGEIFGSSTIAPTGHKYTDETGAENFVIVPATCDAKGSKYLVCTVCGYENTKDAVPYGTPSGHYLFIKEGYAPTCTEDGLTEYVYCLREGCDYEVHAKKIPATGHNDNGDGMCSSCGNKLYEGGSKSCGCLCHKDSVIMRFIYKIVLFFWKLFRIKHDCGCGSIHY